MTRKRPVKVAVLTLTVPDSMQERVASFLGHDIIRDPAFWQLALATGVEELERQFREIERESEEEAEAGGYTVILGTPTVIDPDDLPF